MLTTFHLFPQLPAELRLIVWSYARLEYPRIHRVIEWFLEPARSFEVSGIKNPLLEASHESRQCVLRTSIRFLNPKYFSRSDSLTRLDYTIDTLYLDVYFNSMLRSPAKEAQLYQPGGLFEGELLEKLMFLAIRFENCVECEVTENEYLPLTKFKDLQKIVCVGTSFRRGKIYKFCYDSPTEGGTKIWQSWVRDLKTKLNRVQEHDKTWKLPVFTFARQLPHYNTLWETKMGVVF
jgi:hypothetical protein